MGRIIPITVANAQRTVALFTTGNAILDQEHFMANYFIGVIK